MHRWREILRATSMQRHYVITSMIICLRFRLRRCDVGLKYLFYYVLFINQSSSNLDIKITTSTLSTWRVVTWHHQFTFPCTLRYHSMLYTTYIMSSQLNNRASSFTGRSNPRSHNPVFVKRTLDGSTLCLLQALPINDHVMWKASSFKFTQGKLVVQHSIIAQTPHFQIIRQYKHHINVSFHLKIFY